MRIKSLRLLVIGCFSAVFTVTAWASGGESEDNDSFEEFDTSAYQQQQRKVVDQSYETGKAIYTGRKTNTPKLSYCLRDGEQTVALKRKSIKQHKQGSYSSLAASLVDCDNPSLSVKQQLGSKDFLYVLYYLDKRCKLKLERS